MNNDIVQGKWKQIKGDVKQFFGKLTDDDMTRAEGGQDKIVGVLQERYGYTKEQAEREWSEFSDRSASKWSQLKADVNGAAADVAADAKRKM